MTITTPSGYQVTISERLTYRQRIELDKIVFANTKIKADEKGKPNMSDMDASFVFEMNKTAVGFLVTEIKVEDKVYTSKDMNLYELILDWDEKDGVAVMDAIDKVTSPSKKKE